MLCADCENIFLDYDKHGFNHIPAAYERCDHYPALPLLDLGAHNGCEFCQLLHDTIKTTLASKTDLDEHSSEPIKICNACFFCDQTGVYELTLEVNGPSVGTFFLRVTVSADEGESVFGIFSSVES